MQVPPAADLKTQIAALITPPGMTCLTELTARSDVNSQPVESVVVDPVLDDETGEAVEVSLVVGDQGHAK